EKIIEYFISLTKIPHCSQEAERLLEFLETFAKERGYSVQIDETKNILIKKGKPKLSIQAHYDMVCIGEANIETYIEDGWMYAKDSSLGADNGIAIAMMMVLMDRGEELEFLFTSDEEIGLVGASALEFELDSGHMLNLDFEDEAEVCIGCAGGADLVAFETFEECEALDYFYRVSVTGLAGGHSGVDIDKGIPNAIKVLANYLKEKNLLLSSFEGGERRNSIPANAYAIVSSKDKLNSSGMVEVIALDNRYRVYQSEEFLNLLNIFEDGVENFNQELNIPDTSINLAIVSFEEGDAIIESSARAMSDEGLKAICKKNQNLAIANAFKVGEEFKYPAWRPEKNEFTKIVNSSMTKVFGRSEYKAIHAGLECGVISEKYPNIKFASIGPTIIYPHSTREKMKLDSVGKIFEVVEEIVNRIK
ncbi:aminoacyl-histidine dipeptidase, partial [Sulfurovum sp. bin170]|uniref:M20/M25/M40 family metallo-hydrolase n=1 Tax=Sulfurovum sp. bin170 TaxID=2695268 RepID=UPI0013E0DD5E